MCGIAGLLGAGWGAHPGALRALVSPIRHRGPDDEGYLVLGRDAFPRVYGGDDTPAAVFAHASPYRPCQRLPHELPPDTRAALGHRRLSILDVSPAGHQPMCTPDSKLWVVFNGEVFNYVELRTELVAAGHSFATGSDTEVLLAAYREWGADCLARLNGMFAFLLLDLERGTLFAARDRFGVKPLYYRVMSDGRVAFASEIKQLIALADRAPALNGQRAYDFLAWGITDHTGETLFDGVRQVPPGCFIELPLNGGAGAFAPPDDALPVRRWYTLTPALSPRDHRDAVAEWGELLRDAVRLRLRSDVPLGSCLSGGLDSSAIVCLVREALDASGTGERQCVFTATSDVAAVDERRWVDEVVRTTRVEAHAIQPEPGALLGALDRLTWHQDEPFGSTSIFAQWTVFELAARCGMRVMLDGQGADEQLGGYHGFFAARHASLLRAGRLGALASELRAGRRIHGHSAAMQIMQLANLLLPEPARQGARALAGRGTTRPPWLDLVRLNAEPGDPLRNAGALSPDVTQMSLAQLTGTNLQMLLHWEDRDSMAHSIEARVPFLDYRLVERTLGLPDELKLAGGVTKRVLREALRGVLPEAIRTRTSKLGFATPEQVWMTERQPDAFRALVRRAVERSAGILTADAVARCDAIIGGRAPFSFLPWRLISFGAWLERFGVSG